jgi:hypothetical protein
LYLQMRMIVYSLVVFPLKWLFLLHELPQSFTYYSTLCSNIFDRILFFLTSESEHLQYSLQNFYFSFFLHIHYHHAPLSLSTPNLISNNHWHWLGLVIPRSHIKHFHGMYLSFSIQATDMKTKAPWNCPRFYKR